MFAKIKELILFFLKKRVVRYLIAGALTTLVNYLSYIALEKAIGVNPANIAAWCIAVVFAYFINKLFVFESRAWRGVWVKESLNFLLGRAATGVLEIVGLPLLMKAGLDGAWFGVDGLPAKVIVTVVVLILNYVFSLFLAFRKRDKGEK